MILFLKTVGIAIIDLALQIQFTTESKIPGSDSTASLAGVAAVESLRY